MPVTPNLGLTYPTPFDPLTADLWGGILNTLFLALDAEFAVRTISQDYGERTLRRARLKDNSETTLDLGNISGDVTITYSDAHYQYATVTGDITSLTINGWTASGAAAYMTLELIQDGTGGHSITLDSTYRTQNNGEGISLSTAANAVDKLRFESRDNGATIDAYANLGMA